MEKGRTCPTCGVEPEKHPDQNNTFNYVRNCNMKYEAPYWINPNKLQFCVDVSFSIPAPKFNTETDQEEDVIENPQFEIQEALRKAMEGIKGIEDISIDNYDLI